MEYKASDELKELIGQFEGLVLKAYRCPAGVLTIGFGHTKGVKAGQTITEEQAYKFLEEDIKPIEKYLNKVNICKTQGEFDALVDFIFNLGLGSFKSSTLYKYIKAGRSDDDICSQFRRWVYANGKKLNGLVRRREAECDLWMSNK